MTIVAVSKNKRTQPVFRLSPAIRPVIVLIYNEDIDIDDMIYVAELELGALEVALDDPDLDVELVASIEVEFDDLGPTPEVC